MQEGKFYEGYSRNWADRALLESVCKLAGEAGGSKSRSCKSVCDKVGKRT